MSTPSFFGRAWKVTVQPPPGDARETLVVSNSSFDAEALRVTFSIDQVAIGSYWYADIAIYNCLPALQQLIKKGDIVTVEAGYQSPGVAQIFNGRVYQPLWERENGTDYKLTLHCFVGLFEDELGWSTTTIAANTTQSQAVYQVAAATTKNVSSTDPQPISVDYLDPALGQKAYPRGFAYSGPARAFFDQIASDNNMRMWIGWNGVSISGLQPTGTVPDRVYAPPLSPSSNVSSNSGLTKYTLIGTPQQTQEGVAFRTLLDGDLKLGSLVKLDMAIANKLAAIPNQKPLLVDKDGLYVVAGIHQTGDTRGNDWYSDITAVTRELSKLQGVILL